MYLRIKSVFSGTSNLPSSPAPEMDRTSERGPTNSEVADVVTVSSSSLTSWTTTVEETSGIFTMYRGKTCKVTGFDQCTGTDWTLYPPDSLLIVRDGVYYVSCGKPLIK